MREPWYTVDPGLSGTGLACFYSHQLRWSENFYPKGNSFQFKTMDVMDFLLRHIASYAKVFIEWPTGQHNSLRGLAAQNSDSILKLAYLIGSICRAFPNNMLIPVIKHIGNLPKEINHKRVNRYFNVDAKNHAADALSIGKYVIEQKLIS